MPVLVGLVHVDAFLIHDRDGTDARCHSSRDCQGIVLVLPPDVVLVRGYRVLLVRCRVW